MPTPSESERDPIVLLESLARFVERERQVVVEQFWDMAEGVVLANQEEVLRLLSQLTVLDDMFQDLLVDFVPLRIGHNPAQFYATLARDISRWQVRGHGLSKGECPEGVDHTHDDLELKMHKVQGQTYLRLSEQLLEMVNAFMSGSVA